VEEVLGAAIPIAPAMMLGTTTMPIPNNLDAPTALSYPAPGVGVANRPGYPKDCAAIGSADLGINQECTAGPAVTTCATLAVDNLRIVSFKPQVV
jgi:hypothetical protein